MGSSCQCRTVAVNDSKRHCQEKKYDGKTQWWCLVVDFELTGWVLIQNFTTWQCKVWIYWKGVNKKNHNTTTGTINKKDISFTALFLSRLYFICPQLSKGLSWSIFCSNFNKIAFVILNSSNLYKFVCTKGVKMKTGTSLTVYSKITLSGMKKYFICNFTIV